MALPAERPAFTLRFHRQRTHRALRHVADQLGVSMSEIAERAIEHELAVIGAELEDRLRETVELLRTYRGAGAESDAEAIAEAEVAEEDPLRSRRVSGWSDPLGVGAAFADLVE